jgi:hypothetical protein
MISTSLACIAPPPPSLTGSFVAIRPAGHDRPSSLSASTDRQSAPLPRLSYSLYMHSSNIERYSSVMREPWPSLQDSEACLHVRANSRQATYRPAINSLDQFTRSRKWSSREPIVILPHSRMALRVYREIISTSISCSTFEALGSPQRASPDDILSRIHPSRTREHFRLDRDSNTAFRVLIRCKCSRLFQLHYDIDARHLISSSV